MPSRFYRPTGSCIRTVARPSLTARVSLIEPPADIGVPVIDGLLQHHNREQRIFISQPGLRYTQWAVYGETCTTNFARFVKLPENVKKEKELFTAANVCTRLAPETLINAVTNALLTNAKRQKIKDPRNLHGYEDLSGAPSGIRTPDTLLKRQVLYRLS